MGVFRIWKRSLPEKWEKARQIGFNLLDQAHEEGVFKQSGAIQVRHEIADAIPDVALIRAALEERYGYVLLIKLNNNMIVRGVRTLYETLDTRHVAPGHWIGELCNGAKTAEEVFAQITAVRMRGEEL